MRSASAGTGTWDQLLTVTQAKLSTKPGVTERKLPIAQIEPNPDQPRQYFEPQALAELAESIKAHGILQPMLVRPHPQAAGRYQIVAGERRYQAARSVGLQEVPVVVWELDDAQSLELALVENVMREDITPLEEARSLQRLIDTFGYSYAKLGERLGKNKAYVDHRVRLLKMPEEIQSALDRPVAEPTDGKLRRPFTPRHAGVVSQIDDADLRQALIDAVFTDHLSVAEATRRKNQLKEVASSVSSGESRARLETAIVAGLPDRDLKFRLAAFQGPTRAPIAETPDARVAVDSLAISAVVAAARAGDGQASAAQLLRALQADRATLRALLAASGTAEADAD